MPAEPSNRLTSDRRAAAPPVVHASLLRAEGIAHGFFGRRGGVSARPYTSLNAGLDSGDAPANISENRRRICDALGVPAAQLISARQVHSAEAIAVTKPGAMDDDRREVDGFATSTPGLALSIATADCAPVLFADATACVIGAAHAGWRGAISGVTDVVVDLMVQLGAERRRIHAAIGPCISQSAYEVGPEFLERFVAADAANQRFFADGDGDRAHFDLKGYVAHRVTMAGVAQVEVLSHCTFADEAAYFSHRRGTVRQSPERGRNLSAIVLESDDA